MAVQPTNKTLLIPNKNALSPAGYLRDMQTLEVWARQPIQQLIAGSGITLSPTSGRGPGPVTISSTGGGGGGTTPIQCYLNQDATTISQIVGFGIDLDGYSYPGLFSNSSGSSQFVGFGGMWFGLDQSQSLAILPIFVVPTYTGGGLTVSYCSMGTFDITNYVFPTSSFGQAFTTVPFNLPSGTTVQMATTDFGSHTETGYIFTPGTGTTGNGYIPTPGGSNDLVAGSIYGVFEIADGTTFS